MWRIGMLLFAVIGLISVGMLAAFHFAWPSTMPITNALAEQSWFFVAETILLGITAAGLIGMIVFAIAAPRKSRQLIVERDNGGVRISQAALRATVQQVVESHRGLSLEKATAKIVGRANPRMDIRIRVNPGTNTDLGELGSKLQSEIAAAVEHFASCPVRSVNLVFLEPSVQVAASQTSRSNAHPISRTAPTPKAAHPNLHPINHAKPIPEPVR